MPQNPGRPTTPRRPGSAPPGPPGPTSPHAAPGRPRGSSPSRRRRSRTCPGWAGERATLPHGPVPGRRTGCRRPAGGPARPLRAQRHDPASTWTATRWACCPRPPRGASPRWSARTGAPAWSAPGAPGWSCRSGGRPGRPGTARRGPGPGRGQRLDHGQPVQAGVRGAGRAARPAGHRDRRRQLPDRPVRAERHGQAAGGRAADDPHRPGRGGHPGRRGRRDRPGRPRWSACPTWPTAAARWPTWPGSARSCTRPGRWCCGTCATRRARSRSSWTRTAPTSPSAAPTST